MIKYDRLILALTPEELEQFVRDWVESKSKNYFKVERFSGSGDKGRDVVGFLSKKLHEGEWNNYQCKQYSSKVGTGPAITEIGKILYYAFKGEFTAPLSYNFVAPKGINRNLEKLIFKPNTFKSEVISSWDEHCRNKIIENDDIPLSDDLKTFIESYDFSRIGKINLANMLSDSAITTVLFKWFKADPGPAPQSQVPDMIQDIELPYVEQLLKAYEEKSFQKISSVEDLKKFAEHKTHFFMQRERFFEADVFKRFYRDNTNKEIISDFEKEVYHGIFETYQKKHEDSLEKVNAVMTQAANVVTTGPVAQYAKVPVKQGVCHHFVNEKKIKWKK